MSSTIRHPSSAARHPLPAFITKCAAQSSRLLSASPPALVALFATPPSDSSHHPLPAVHATTSPPPSLLQPPPHPDRSCSAVRVSLPALVMLSARHRHCCRDPLLALTTLVTPSAAHSPRAVLPPGLRHRPTVVAVTSRCKSRETLITTSTWVSTVFASHCQPLAEQRCRVRSHVSPDARHRCCHHRCIISAL